MWAWYSPTRRNINQKLVVNPICAGGGQLDPNRVKSILYNVGSWNLVYDPNINQLEEICIKIRIWPYMNGGGVKSPFVSQPNLTQW